MCCSSSTTFSASPRLDQRSVLRLFRSLNLNSVNLILAFYRLGFISVFIGVCPAGSYPLCCGLSANSGH